jgi:hypothetical protein
MNILQTFKLAGEGETGLNILQELVKQGPLFALFVAITIYLVWKLDKKEKEIKELHEYIRENEKENLKILNDVNNTLDQVTRKQNDTNEIVAKEVQHLKEFIKLIIDRD